MQRLWHQILPRITHLLIPISLSFAASAQPTGALYDPEPPADSAYVRVILANRAVMVDVRVDGQPRIRKLAGGVASDYLVLAAGKHTVALHPVGKPVAYLSTAIDVIRGRAMTMAFTALLTDSAPVLFEDKTNSNKLKALLAVYHLDSKTESVDILTADGNTKVFSNLAFGASNAIPVNPITIDLVATKVGDKTPKARTSLIMAQSGAYSIFLLPGESGKLMVRSTQNKIERYTGK